MITSTIETIQTNYTDIFNFDWPKVILRGFLGSTGNALGIFAVLAGAPVGSIAAFRSVNSIVASMGNLAMAEISTKSGQW